MIETITTVGVGEIYPQSPGGRFLTSIAFIFGQAMLSILVSILYAKFNVN
jgi:hypothetical protein